MDLAALTATEQKALLDAGKASCRELLADCRTRAAMTEPVVNAIPTIHWETAEDLAGRLDDNPTLLEGTPLRGLVTAFKDLSDTAGVLTTRGSLVFADNVPTEDAPLIAHLRRCGLVPIGKTNTPEFGKGSHTFNPVLGLTRNPWDPTRSAGGSSGGAAVALACGSLSIADGSDLGGSLRNPAAFNAVVGFRPTTGSVPLDAHPDPRTDHPIAGPMGRTVADMALLLGVMGTGEMFTDSAPAIPRVAFSPNLGDLPVDPAIRLGTTRAIEALADAGWDVEEACPDLMGADDCFEDLRALFQTFHMAALVDDERVKATARYEIRRGLSLDAARIAKAVATEGRIRSEWDRFFVEGRFDAFLSPTTQVPPFPIDMEWVDEIDGEHLDHYTHWMRSCSRITVTGAPSASIPAGFTDGGLPVGVQFAGRRHGDAALVTLLAAAEEIFGTAPAPDIGALAALDPRTLPPGPLG
ncbi:MAG: amidase family protein [Actinomycetota bacterium]|nr:amidase family protein [Actinomycetota bacterium]MED5232015.1 amidase family protein [Actinomycetota bacterium]MED5394523.1 amidase family protein [Actinomycetota bacterium]MEE3353358.1 amidase family protein [Actinomycetota bacterium]